MDPHKHVLMWATSSKHLVGFVSKKQKTQALNDAAWMSGRSVCDELNKTSKRATTHVEEMVRFERGVVCTQKCDSSSAFHQVKTVALLIDSDETRRGKLSFCVNNLRRPITISRFRTRSAVRLFKSDFFLL